MKRNRKKGFFIVFEGTEGSGKSTQIRRAVRFLKHLKRQVLVLREPGGTRTSEAIRKILLDKRLKGMTAEAELLLYLAARAQVVREKILPALRKGFVVVSDRFETSTLAYQGYGRSLPLRGIDLISRLFVRKSLRPDLIFLLDLDPVRGMKRGGRHDRIERESYAFHRRVRKGYLAMAHQDSKRFVVIDALESKETVAQKIRKYLNDAFRHQG